MTPRHTTTLTHGFETAHRLPQLAGKCTSVHGHSWQVHVTIGFPVLDHDGIGVEFGAYKATLRRWIDTELDHGIMLGADDPLAELLAAHQTKVFRFGASDAEGAEKLAYGMGWPTVENVAVLLHRVAAACLDETPHAVGGRVVSVEVRETATNTSTYSPREVQA